MIRCLIVAAGLSLGLAGCLNTARPGSMPNGSEAASQQVKEHEPVLRGLIAKALVNSREVKGGLLGSGARVTNATITGPNVHQDYLSRAWAVIYCVKADAQGILPHKINSQVAVFKTEDGWRISGRKIQIGIDCGLQTRPFPELMTLANEQAEAAERAKR